jgi:putative ATP-dependent endonuclease of OLD family
MNLLFIATELLLLENSIVSNSIGPKITLIEELEAHLHTQAQIRLVKYLEKIVNDNKGSQFILTSHSTNLVSSISPESLIYLNENTAHSLSQEYTMLENEDYKFLERFLDSTKSNLFFAKGLILVEGDSELLLLPAIAELIDIPLHKYGISLINIGGTSFKRYIKLFSTQNEKCINLPISLVTDIDVRPKIYFKEENKEVYQINSKNRIEVEKIIDKNIEMTQVKIDDIYTRYTDMIKDLEINADNVKKELVSLTKQVIDDIKIKEEINEKRKKLVGKYSKYNANIEMCISPEWTLEYCLLFSPLQSLMKDAIFEAQYKTPFGAVTQSKIVDIESKLSIDETKEIAIYNLFKRLNEKKVSKAIVAQILANKILDLDKKEKEKLKSELLKDIYSRYLINSIYHASGLNLIKEEVNE